MENRIKIKCFKAGSLFKLTLIGCAGLFIPFSILCGILSIFGIGYVTLGGEEFTGIMGLILSPFVGIILTLFSSIFGWIGLMIGFWVYSRFNKSIELEFIPSE